LGFLGIEEGVGYKRVRGKFKKQNRIMIKPREPPIFDSFYRIENQKEIQ